MHIHICAPKQLIIFQCIYILKTEATNLFRVLPVTIFVYLGGNLSENGRVDVEVRRRIQAGANAWRNVGEVMVDRKISRKLKGHGFLCGAS